MIVAKGNLRKEFIEGISKRRRSTFFDMDEAKRNSDFQLKPPENDICEEMEERIWEGVEEI